MQNPKLSPEENERQEARLKVLLDSFEEYAKKPGNEALRTASVLWSAAGYSEQDTHDWSDLMRMAFLTLEDMPPLVRALNAARWISEAFVAGAILGHKAALSTPPNTIVQ